MRTLISVAAAAALITSNAVACSLFEGVYRTADGTTAKVASYDLGLGLQFSPSGRIYIENDHCIMPDCLSDSMVLNDAHSSDDFPNPFDIALPPPAEIDTDNPPQTITIKGEEYQFVCPATTAPATM